MERRHVLKRLKPLLVGARNLSLQTLDLVALSAVPRLAVGSNRVLVVRVDEIGDYVLHRRALRDIREYFESRGQVVELICNKLCFDLAAADGVASAVYALDKRRFTHDWTYRVALLGQVRRGGYGVVVQPRYARLPEIEDALTFAAAASRRIGFARSDFSFYPRTLYNETFALPPLPAGRAYHHEFELSRAVAEHFQTTSARVIMSAPPYPVLPPSASLPQRYVVLFPKAGWAGREWPQEYFVDLARRIHEHFGFGIVVCSAQPLPDLAAALQAAVGTAACDLAGQTTLRQLTRIIAGAEAVLTNETSASHIAAATDTPCLTLLGGGHFGRFMPYPPQSEEARRSVVAFHPMPCFQCDWNCIYPREATQPTPCVAHIDPEDVWQKMQTLLQAERHV